MVDEAVPKDGGYSMVAIGASTAWHDKTSTIK
jgi:hypothetical protein